MKRNHPEGEEDRAEQVDPEVEAMKGRTGLVYWCGSNPLSYLLLAFLEAQSRFRPR